MIGILNDRNGHQLVYRLWTGHQWRQWAFWGVFIGVERLLFQQMNQFKYNVDHFFNKKWTKVYLKTEGVKLKRITQQFQNESTKIKFRN